MLTEKIHSEIENSKEQYINTLKELVAYPSVSTNKAEVYKCAIFVKDLMEDLGISTQLIETKGNPILMANIKSKQPNKKTVLFYGHYDVQPPEPLELWNSEPFDLTIRDGKMYGRGSADNKGQFLAHLLGIGEYLKLYKDVPVNIKIVLDGEEEIGSENLTNFARENKDLFATDIAITSDGPMGLNNVPAVSFGVRGVMNFDLTIETANIDHHSGNKGGVIKNAAWELMKVLKTMLDDNDNVLIKGFYDDVQTITTHDIKLINNLEYKPEKLAEAYGVKNINLDKETFYKNLMLRPTLTINGLNSGYLGDDCKNIIPKKAVAKMEVRLVANQDPFDILKKIEDHVKMVNEDVQFKLVEEVMYPSRTQTDIEIGKVVIDSMRNYLDKEITITPAGGGSLPDYIWTNIVKVPSLMIPYGNIDESNHAPNENFDVELFFRGIHTSVEIINGLGKL